MQSFKYASSGQSSNVLVCDGQSKKLFQQTLNMFGVFKLAFVVVCVGCSTLALPRQRRPSWYADPQVEVIKQGPPCEEKTKLNDDVTVSFVPSGEVGSQVVLWVLYIFYMYLMAKPVLRMNFCMFWIKPRPRVCYTYV